MPEGSEAVRRCRANSSVRHFGEEFLHSQTVSCDDLLDVCELEREMYEEINLVAAARIAELA